MQGIYAWLTGRSICLLYICIVLDLAVGVVAGKASVLDCFGDLVLAVGVAVCKASMLNWLGVYLPSIYMHCTKSSSGCSSMQGIYAWLTVYWYSRHLCSIDWGVQNYQWLYQYARHLCSIDWGSICLLYICIVWDRAVGVVVCMASMLDWLRGPSAFYIYALLWI